MLELTILFLDMFTLGITVLKRDYSQVSELHSTTFLTFNLPPPTKDSFFKFTGLTKLEFHFSKVSANMNAPAQCSLSDSALFGQQI